ncbi:FecCD family ABC transporter permease [Georgenia sp. AZ-5]|uniref:FecCD family ABC transporter permease n=1 Tax=Georgenia sp. AZ-5 TaxID=3367526 RepID=UPI0037548672
MNPTTTPADPRAPAPAAPRAGKGRPRRRLLGLGVLLAAVAACALLSLAVGSKALPVDLVWSALVTPGGSEADVIVREMRLPRTAVALAAGAALGLSGALMQGHTRNALADPGLLGVSAGAAFAVVIAAYVLGVDRPSAYVWFAFAGALAATVVVLAFGSGRGNPATLALAGAAVTALLGALTSAVVLLDVETLQAYRFWAVGSVAGRDIEVLAPMLPFLLAGTVLALANGPALNSLALGEDVARALGQHVRRARLLGVAAVTLLTGSAVAMCGPIGFVGLIVPHAARAVTGPDHRWLLPYSALAGAAVLLAADVVGRVVVRPAELQAGIVLALVGAPFFVALIRRRRPAAP